MSNVEALNGFLREYVYVESLHLDSEDGLSGYNLLMTLAKSPTPGARNLAVIFFNVGGLNVRGFGGGLTQFMDLCVSRVEGGLDRIRYELVDEEEEKIAFNFHSFKVLSEDRGSGE
ncbi:hypothetical protein [Pseudomonas siliginis]|uniref:hypothetical protein n=1 Tax=Pseudomonas siliginis TaxID=2842346 RepID=UPI0020938904|nr:hypothetical protein [Pseudomonas siliginis]UST88076.1 hypothetical protein NF678_14680 [Pseudomonas siliginis]